MQLKAMGDPLLMRGSERVALIRICSLVISAVLATLALAAPAHADVTQPIEVVGPESGAIIETTDPYRTRVVFQWRDAGPLDRIVLYDWTHGKQTDTDQYEFHGPSEGYSRTGDLQQAVTDQIYPGKFAWQVVSETGRTSPLSVFEIRARRGGVSKLRSLRVSVSARPGKATIVLSPNYMSHRSYTTLLVKQAGKTVFAPRGGPRRAVFKLPCGRSGRYSYVATAHDGSVIPSKVLTRRGRFTLRARTCAPPAPERPSSGGGSPERRGSQAKCLVGGYVIDPSSVWPVDCATASGVLRDYLTGVGVPRGWHCETDYCAKRTETSTLRSFRWWPR